jgi:hypothetical protein
MYHEINCLNAKGAMLSYTLASNRDFIRFVVEVGLTVAQAKHSCVSTAAYKELVKLQAKMSQTSSEKDNISGLVHWCDKNHLEEAEAVVERCLGIPKVVLEFVRPIKEKALEQEMRMTLAHNSKAGKGKSRRKTRRGSNTAAPESVEAPVVVEAAIVRPPPKADTEEHFDPGAVLRTQSLIRGFLVRQRLRLLQDWRLLFVCTYLFSFYHGLHPQYGGSAKEKATPTLTELMLMLRTTAGEKIKEEQVNSLIVCA